MHLLRWAAASAAALVVAGALAGCSDLRPIAVRYDGDRVLEVFVPVCDGEQVEEIWLDRPGADILWELTATDEGRPLDRVVFGDEPDGYTGAGATDVDDLRALGDELLRFNVRTTRSSQLFGAFRLRELPTDGRAVLLEGDGDVLAADELEAALADECPSGRGSVRWGVVAALLAGIGVGATVAIGAHRRRRRRRRQAGGGADPSNRHG